MIEKMSEEEIIERLETSERTVEELKTQLGNSLSLIEELLAKQVQMAREAKVAGEANRTLAHSIASFIELPASLVAEKIVTVKTANKEMDDVMEAVRKSAEKKITELGSGKVTDEVVEKLVKHILLDVSIINKIAELIGSENIEESIAEYVSTEDIAYHMDAESVAYSVSCSDIADYIDRNEVAGYIDNESVAGYVDHETVAGYIVEEEVAEHLDIAEVAGHIDLDDLASKVKELMD